MPRLSKPRRTDEETYAQRLADADAATRAKMTVSLAGTFHYKKLVRPTLAAHDRTKRLWALFIKTHPQHADAPSEIVPGAKLPEYGAFVLAASLTLTNDLQASRKSGSGG
jgi:hypothetical protein